MLYHHGEKKNAVIVNDCVTQDALGAPQMCTLAATLVSMAMCDNRHNNNNTLNVKSASRAATTDALNRIMRASKSAYMDLCRRRQHAGPVDAFQALDYLQQQNHHLHIYNVDKLKSREVGGLVFGHPDPSDADTIPSLADIVNSLQPWSAVVYTTEGHTTAFGQSEHDAPLWAFDSSKGQMCYFKTQNRPAALLLYQHLIQGARPDDVYSGIVYVMQKDQEDQRYVVIE